MSNPKIKELVRLRKSSRRRKELGLFLVEGRREIVAMLENTIDFEEIYFCRKHMTEDSLDMVIDKFNGKTEIIELTTGPMKKASYRNGSCEMIGVVVLIERIQRRGCCWAANVWRNARRAWAGSALSLRRGGPKTCWQYEIEGSRRAFPAR